MPVPERVNSCGSSSNSSGSSITNSRSHGYNGTNTAFFLPVTGCWPADGKSILQRERPKRYTRAASEGSPLPFSRSKRERERVRWQIDYVSFPDNPERRRLQWAKYGVWASRVMCASNAKELISDAADDSSCGSSINILMACRQPLQCLAE